MALLGWEQRIGFLTRVRCRGVISAAAASAKGSSKRLATAAGSAVRVKRPHMLRSLASSYGVAIGAQGAGADGTVGPRLLNAARFGLMGAMLADAIKEAPLPAGGTFGP